MYEYQCRTIYLCLIIGRILKPILWFSGYTYASAAVMITVIIYLAEFMP